MAPFILEFFHSQLFVTPKYPDTSFSGQTVIVTGSNVGLGFEAARHFVRLGAGKVILAVRNQQRGEQAKQAIEASTQRLGAAEVWPLDLSSYESVKQFAERAASLPRIDAVVENAGINTLDFRMTEQDESTITTNVVSTFLLALLLLPKLRETSAKFNVQPRLSIVTSELHHSARFQERTAENIFDALNDKSKTAMTDRYSVSKLLEVLVVREMAESISQSEKPKVIVNSINPGFCHSDLTREASGVVRFVLAYIMKPLLARTTECGSRTLVAGAAAGEESHGKYTSDGVVHATSNYVQSPEGKKDGGRVWKQLLAKLESIQPGISSNL